MAHSPLDFLLAADATGRRIERATVVGLYADGSVGVDVARAESEPLRCDVLVSLAGTPQALVPGQPVLVWVPGHAGERGVVLGRIGGTRPLAPPPPDVAHPPLAATLPAPRDGDDVPESLVIEARHALTLRVGDGSITLRADGKILIQGRDLVSSAQRLNRIKGGAVSIN